MQEDRAGAQGGVKGSSEQNQRLIQCPLCGKNFPNGVVEYHAASCEGRRDEVDMDGGGSRRRAGDAAGPEILEVNLPPEKPLKGTGFDGRSGPESSTGAKTRPSSSEPAAKRAGPPSSSVRRTPSSSSGRVECPICNERYAKSAIEEHAANCGEEVYV